MILNFPFCPLHWEKEKMFQVHVVCTEFFIEFEWAHDAMLKTQKFTGTVLPQKFCQINWIEFAKDSLVKNLTLNWFDAKNRVLVIVIVSFFHTVSK